jgi:hypothetical protein
MLDPLPSSAFWEPDEPKVAAGCEHERQVETGATDECD